MLIDGGEAYRYRYVRNFLDGHGIFSALRTGETGVPEGTEVLDDMLLTHAHRDQYQVQAGLLRRDYLPKLIGQFKSIVYFNNLRYSVQVVL